MTKYITTPIYYLNGDPHIGHAYTTILGDIIKRAAVMKGEEAFYTTGTDEHGQKNQAACEKSPLPAEQYLKEKSDNFRHLFEELGIEFDFFVRTSYPEHKEVVKKCLDIIHKKDLIIKKSYTGLYCEGCEQFKKEADLDEQGCCPDHKVRPVEIAEENYFLRLEPFREWLVNHIKDNPDWIQPKFFAVEVLNMLKDPIEDLCISRPKKRVTLGVEFPFDSDYVTYIWFDALANYISSLDWPENMDKFNKYWPHSVHLMAKDIIKPHCIYWPIMLKALGLEPPHNIMVHGYWVGEGGVKMSKSIGNVVDPNVVIAEVGVDCLRFYLSHTMSSSNDAQISSALIKELYRQVGNNIGNLHMRSCKMLEKYNNSIIPDVELTTEDKAFIEMIAKELQSALRNLDNIESISKLTEKVINIGSQVNAYVDKTSPWTLAKDESKKEELFSCLYTLLEAIRLIGVAVTPVMPGISAKIAATFNLQDRQPVLEDLKPFGLEKGKPLGEVVMLFPRLED